MNAKHIIAAASLCILSGCAALPMAAGGGALGTVLAVASAAQPEIYGVTVLTEAAQAACAGQQAANLAGDMATRLNAPTAAADASKVSVALGFACRWL